MKNKIAGIEVLRGIAALSVVLHHCWSLSSMPHFKGYIFIEGLGSWGVTLFFLLSGYLLATVWWNDNEDGALLRFWKKRFFRIAPAYYANITILLVFFASHGSVFSTGNIKNIIAQYSFTHYLYIPAASSFNMNGALWTITIEIILYALIPLLATLFLKYPKTSFLVFMGLSVGYRFYVTKDIDTLLFIHRGAEGADNPNLRLFLSRQFMGQLGVFTIGIGLAYLMRKYEKFGEKKIFSYGYLLMIPVGAISILLLQKVEVASFYTNRFWFVSFDYLLALTLIPLLILAIFSSNWKFYGLEIFSNLGKWSYGIYLWHFPIILSVYGRGAFEYPLGDVSVIDIVLIFALAILFGFLSYELVERPGQKLAHRFKVPKVMKADLEKS